MVAIYDSNRYIKRLNNIEIDDLIKPLVTALSVHFSSLPQRISLNSII